MQIGFVFLSNKCANSCANAHNEQQNGLGNVDEYSRAAKHRSLIWTTLFSQTSRLAPLHNVRGERNSDVFCASSWVSCSFVKRSQLFKVYPCRVWRMVEHFWNSPSKKARYNSPFFAERGKYWSMITVNYEFLFEYALYSAVVLESLLLFSNPPHLFGSKSSTLSVNMHEHSNRG